MNVVANDLVVLNC